MNYHFEDFTEENYHQFIHTGKSHWKFISFNQHNEPGNVCLLRHDIDFSVHRALRVAQIEASEGVKSTYFLLPHSEFYNLFEKEVTDIVFKIRDLGHDLGLHFDPTYYQREFKSRDDLEKAISLEKNWIENIFNVKLTSFSFHNPDLGNWLDFDDISICGLVNAYSKVLTGNFTYCSDSNGYWRTQRLKELCLSSPQRLYVLTHPAWWTPDVLSPRDRILRCIEGRAAKTLANYDRLLSNSGRINLRSK